MRRRREPLDRMTGIMAHFTGRVTAAGIDSAAKRLAGRAVATPLLENEALNAATGGRIFLKAENLQRTGSFKFRGAFNKLGQIPEGDRARGVVAYSSGNHAQGVAHAARLLGIPATIVMPEDAPAIKVARTRRDGAEVIFYDRYTEDRMAIGERIMSESGAILVPPYDDADVIAGQGTVGLEITAQAAALGVRIDAAAICCGGGGLSAGSAIALKAASPQTEIWTAEPLGYDDMRVSLERGTRTVQETRPGSRLCDALMTPFPGHLTYAIGAEHFTGGIAVRDAEVTTAMAFAFRELKLVVEPGGAAALAAVLAGKIETAGRCVAVTLSGGNVDADTFSRLISEP